MIKVVSRKLYFFSAIVFFLCAIYSLVGRYVVTTAPSYKPILEQWLSQQFNVPIRIGKLEAHWEILNPVVYATDIHIAKATQRSIQEQKEFPRLQQIKLHIHLLSSLWHHALRLRGMDIEGLEITLRKTPAGQLQLVGIPMSSTPFELSQWIDSILRQQHITLKQVRIHYKTATQSSLLSTEKISWAQGHLQASRIHLSQVNHLSQANKKISKVIPQLSARVQWQKSNPHNWRVLVDSLTMQYAGRMVKNERIFVEQQQDATQKNPLWRIQASRLPIAWLLDSTPFVGALLTALKPQGELTGVNLLLASDAVEKFKLMNFSSTFSQLSSQAYNAIPGFSGLNGFVAGNLEKGVIRVDSKNFTLDLKDIFRWPVSAQQLSTQLRWFTDDRHQLQLESGLVSVLANGAQGRGFISMTFPLKGPAILRLNASVWNGDGRDTPKYLPTQAMSPGLVHWLDTAILSGHLAEGNFLFNGSVGAQASLENRQHTFQMRYQVEQAELDYSPPWPKLSSVTADALILGREAEIQLKHGRIEKNSEATGIVTVPYFSSTEIPHLRVAAQVRSNAADGVHVLQTSPIRESLSDVINSLEGQGPIAVALNLDIPLEESISHPVASKIKVNVDLDNIQLNLIDAGLAAQQIKGQVTYQADTGLQASKLTGMLLGQPVSAGIKTVREKHNRHIRLSIKNDYLVAAMRIPTEKTTVRTPLAIEVKKLMIDADWLAQLKDPANHAKSIHLLTIAKHIDPSGWPPLNISIEGLKIANEDWGSWRLQTQPQRDGLQINRVDGQFKELHVQGHGLWNVLNKPSTHFEGTAETQDIYAVMNAWGYTPSATSQQAKTTFDLTWPGAPFNASLMNTKGSFDVSVMKGKLLDVEAASSIKAVSLFNIQHLQRRLQLDFSDLFKKGISYDQMKGHFELSQGILSTPQFAVTGPSIQFVVRGKAYLDKHTLDQQLDLTVPVGRNLVIPAAVIGGVPAAATLYMIDKALGSRLDKLATFHFSLEGDWDKPKVTQHLFKANP